MKEFVFGETGGWLGDEGPDSDVVISTRVRLARNLTGFRFSHCADRVERLQVIAMVRDQAMALPLGEELTFLDLVQSDRMHNSLLMERHLISKQMAHGDAPRAVILSPDESVSIMVHEEDHLRLQVLSRGRQSRSAFDKVNRIDDFLGSVLPIAFHDRFGFLTSCPTNVGTGIRLSVMLHLPALMITKEIERVRRAARDMQLAVRGSYGEGSEAHGDLFQISNQTTFGKSEEQLLSDFDEGVMPKILEYERRARQVLLKRRAALLDDRCHRALAILRSARLLKLEESLRHLSHVRLGLQMGRLSGITAQEVDGLFIRVHPAHLQLAMKRPLNQAERTEARATLVREVLGAS